MINNLIIGGVDGVPFETKEQTKEELGAIFRDNLHMPDVRLQNMKTDRIQRIGQRIPNKPRKILVAFADINDKNFVKSFRKHLEYTQMFMHDQYPPNVVAYRKKLVPILKCAKDGGKEAYIKYNKLIVDGAVHTDG